MLKLYIADCDELADGQKFNKYYSLADGVRRGKVDALCGAARRASLGAYALLGLALAEWGYGMGEWRTEACGKPRFADPELPFFSLSHSGRYALCALSDGEVGCDIQKMRPFDERVAGRIMTAGELALFRTLGGRQAEEYFYRLWTVKESYVKYTGEGLSRLSSAQADAEGHMVVCGRMTGATASSFFLGEYAVACCAGEVCSLPPVLVGL